jgi:hypothetical protein
VLRDKGVCPEAEWPYDEMGGDYHGHFRAGSIATHRPSDKAVADAKPHRDIADYSVKTIDDMQKCLAPGLPFVFGFQIYSSFYQPGTYDPDSQMGTPLTVIPYPKPGECRDACRCVDGMMAWPIC